MLGVRVGNTSDLISSPFQTAFKGVSMRLAATLLALAAMSLPGAAVAQNAASSGPSFDGTLAIIRLSEITPEGSVDKFKAAVAAHQAWYASHGYKDIIFESPVLVPDPATKKFVVSDKETLTYHYYGPTTQAEPTHDASWDAYVQLYRGTSSIKDTYLTCIPKGMSIHTDK
jgi:hypothetical protein